MLAKIDETASECGRAKAKVCEEVFLHQFCIGRLNKTDSKPTLSPLIQRARNVGLAIYPWTFRNEVVLVLFGFLNKALQEMYMALDFLGDPIVEMEFFSDPANGIAIDGAFVDCPETYLRYFNAQNAFQSQTSSPAQPIERSWQKSRDLTSL